ncbi:MAG: hypothetical protein ACR2M1_04775 [Gemmatimonadaceae bacterium]
MKAVKKKVSMPPIKRDAQNVATPLAVEQWPLERPVPYARNPRRNEAAVACGRSAALTELSPLYCDVIVTRWENATGQKAVRSTEATTRAA